MKTKLFKKLLVGLAIIYLPLQSMAWGTEGHRIAGYIAESLASFSDAFVEDHQVLLEQNDICRFFRDIDGGINRNSDVGSFERRPVVQQPLPSQKAVPAASLPWSGR